jgi:hypothetical protein
MKVLYIKRSRGSWISIVPGYRLDNWAIEVRSPVEAGNFSSNLCVQTGSGAHPVSCTLGIVWGGGVLQEKSLAGVWRWPLSLIQCQGRKRVGAIHPPHCLHRRVVGLLYVLLYIEIFPSPSLIDTTTLWRKNCGLSQDIFWIRWATLHI